VKAVETATYLIAEGYLVSTDQDRDSHDLNALLESRLRGLRDSGGVL
jgi:hypothetical protein